MPDADPTRQLELIADSDDFVSSSSELVEAWISAGAGVETVEPILRFIEQHPDIDFGSPGPLVHLTERFYPMATRRGCSSRSTGDQQL